MPYICPDAESLDGSPAFGTQQCVPLVEHYANAPVPATRWHQGAVVRDNAVIAKGTAIATFVNGRYSNAPTGNHAALYLSQDAGGVWVIDQYFGSNGIHKRRLRFKGRNSDGSFMDPSNNGDAFSVVE